jgi:hypothetical protein
MLFSLNSQIGEAELRGGRGEIRGAQARIQAVCMYLATVVSALIYVPAEVSLCWLYVLCRRKESEVTIGMTGGCPSRV